MLLYLQGARFGFVRLAFCQHMTLLFDVGLGSFEFIFESL
jgi:hypothetical protein